MNPCACGCGEMVAKRVKRGHWGRLPEARAMYEDPEHRRKLAEGRRAAGNEKLRGRSHSPERRAAIAAGRAASLKPARRGFAAPKSPETRARISAALRARAAANPGAQRVAARDGDVRQAHDRIRQLVRAGLLPAPRTVPCTDCGQVWAEGLSRHEYDHHHGYGAEHHGCAEVVCSRCHHIREKARGNVRQPFGRKHLGVVVER